MISQIVSAHPEELRMHLEEAAGISKYKERRKETESRIKSTRENLARLNDVREEVEKQLEHLNRQAKAAQRYQELQAEHRTRDAELRALLYRAVANEMEIGTSAVRQSELQLESLMADQRQIEAQLEAQRDHHTSAGDHLNNVQAEVYRIGGDIARVEQSIRYNKDLHERLERAQQETERAWTELNEHIAADREQVENLKFALAQDEPRLAELTERAELSAESLAEMEAKLAEWQTQWEYYNKTSGEAARAAEVERTRLDYLDRQCLDVAKRLEILQREKQSANFEELRHSLDQLTIEQETQKEKVETLTQILDERKISYEEVIKTETEIQRKLNESRQSLQTLRGRLSSLEALQHAALGQEKNPATAWLEQNGLDRSQRLGEALEVESGWERAVETVLSDWLEGMLVDSPLGYAEKMGELQNADVALLAKTPALSPTLSPMTLASKVRGPAAIVNWLSRVHIANSLIDAQYLVSQLNADESVITPRGEWLGSGFARVMRSQGKQAGVLLREREIQALSIQIEPLTAEIEMATMRLEEIKTLQSDAERQRDDVQRELYLVHRRLAEISGQVQSQHGKWETAQSRIGVILQEIEQLTEKLEADQTQAREARARLDIAVTAMGDLEQQRQQLEAERRRLLEAREEARANARETRDLEHQLALSIQSKRASIVSLEQALFRMHGQLKQLESRKVEIAEQLTSEYNPLGELEAERQIYLDQRLLIDKQLVEARKKLEDCDAEFRRLEQERHRTEHQMNQRRDALAEQRLAAQRLQMRAESLGTAITEAGLELQTVLEALPADADPGVWQQQIIELEAKIKRLEPVNLAAIQEYEEQSQRKIYLDSQLTDLNTALETLENAIKKIDKETRQRFKETFDRINAGLQELFPRLFGGGHAYLELTGEDLLDTGVSIMARPPGKRISNITLLSGGEKALSAVALVFSIFRLNPAPFCLLDEVDAPLDEANVGRFSQLVGEMSERVQFLFVTHNKSTMEAAQQLCGVTMREPGVSRLVQVDLAEAAKLANAA